MRVHLAFVPALAVVVFSTALSAPASITLTESPPNVIRQGTTLTVAGAVRKLRRTGKAALESKRSARWVMLANTKIGKHGRFALSWTVPGKEAIGPISLRVAVVHRNLVLAATPPIQSAIGPAPQLCAPPVPPAVDIPVGDGWIVGGRYNEGGAYPGIKACDGQQYTVTATDSGGKVQATQPVAGGHSYTLAPLPAGNYTLKSDYCTGSATVAAGKQTQADVVCPVP